MAIARLQSVRDATDGVAQRSDETVMEVVLRTAAGEYASYTRARLANVFGEGFPNSAWSLMELTLG